MSERFAGHTPGAAGHEEAPRSTGAHAVAGPDLERQGPMLQTPQKRQELEMNPAERQLFERAMNLVQNRTGMTEDDAKKVATDVVLTARHTPGLSEKPEYMDVRNGHVMMAEKVGKEPIFNGYVNIEQSQQQSPTQQPVSYTHLDVYKRQGVCRAVSTTSVATFFASSSVMPVLFWTRFIARSNSCRSAGFISSSWRLGGVCSICLLYTSRCV